MIRRFHGGPAAIAGFTVVAVAAVIGLDNDPRGPTGPRAPATAGTRPAPSPALHRPVGHRPGDATACAGCHGQDGAGTHVLPPADYLIRQIQGYRAGLSGGGGGTLVTSRPEGGDILALARYFAAVETLGLAGGESEDVADSMTTLPPPTARGPSVSMTTDSEGF